MCVCLVIEPVRLTYPTCVCVEKKIPTPLLFKWRHWFCSAGSFGSLACKICMLQTFSEVPCRVFALQILGLNKGGQLHIPNKKRRKANLERAQECRPEDLRSLLGLLVSISGNMHCKNIHQISCKTPDKSQHAHLLSFGSLLFFDRNA